jgi:transposase
MKQDGRKLDHRTLEVIRKMAVKRVREGEKPSQVIASYGFSRTAIYGWLKAAKGRGKGLRALASRKGTGRPRKLTASQERQVFRWINGKNPMQCQLDGVLWSRAIVRELIQREFGVGLSLASVGTLLSRLGLTVRNPLRRAYQRNPGAIERWKRETYPGIVKEARQTQADIYFWDESGFRADAVHGKSWGVKGQTPIVEVPGQRQGISAASAISARGAFWFSTYMGGMNGEMFVEFLEKLMCQREKPLHLVLDNLAAHKTAAVKGYVSSTNGMLTLHFLPGHAPESNPDERVWSHIKRRRCSTPFEKRGETRSQDP